VGLAVEPGHVNELITIGREVKWALNETKYAQHPRDPRLNGIYGTILFDELGETCDGDLHQRNVTIFADGQLDRSPCGSGSASRVAVLAASSALKPGKNLVHDSIVGSRFVCTVAGQTTADGFAAVIPVVTGMAYRYGSSQFTVDPGIPSCPGSSCGNNQPQAAVLVHTQLVMRHVDLRRVVSTVARGEGVSLGVPLLEVGVDLAEAAVNAGAAKPDIGAGVDGFVPADYALLVDSEFAVADPWTGLQDLVAGAPTSSAAGAPM
jgi:hypothetical protein